jgi:hypothetical protein
MLHAEGEKTKPEWPQTLPKGLDAKRWAIEG